MTAAQASAARLLALAATGARHALRDKALSVLAGFCATLVLLSVVVSQLTVGERARIVTDFGLSAIAILAAVTSIVLTVNQVAREVERRTIDTVLAKPVARWEYVVGRFAGLGATLALMTVAMGAILSVVLACIEAPTIVPWQAYLLGWVECLVLIALALFFSSFATPMPSLFITLGMALVGHTSDGLLLMAARVTSPASRALLHAIHLAVPNLEAFNVRAQVAWVVEIPVLHVLESVAYGVACCGVLLVLASFLLARRDLA